MSDSFAARYWRTVKRCFCPCLYKDEDDIPLIGKVWDNYFKPVPDEPGWDKLPKSIKETVTRTSAELERYAIARKSGGINGEFGHGPIINSEAFAKTAAITDSAKEKLGGIIFGQQNDDQ